MKLFLKTSFCCVLAAFLLFFSYSDVSAQLRCGPHAPSVLKFCPGDDYYYYPYISCDDVNFGEIITGESLTKTVSIRSTGSTLLTITGIDEDPSGVFTFKKPAFPLTVNGNASHTLDITFTPTEARDYRVVLKVQSNAYGYDSEIILTGKALMPLKPNLIVSGSVDFGRHRLGTESTPAKIILENRGNAPARTVRAMFSGTRQNFVFELNAFSDLVIEPQQKVEIPVTFTPNEKGFLNAEFTITAEGNTEHKIALHGVGTSGEIFTEIQRVTFPATELNTPAATADAIITNAEGEFSDVVVITALHRENGAYCDDIDRRSFTLPEVSLPLTLYPGQSVRIPVDFTPYSAGAKMATLNVESDANFLSLPLIGEGKVADSKILSVENNSTTEESTIKYSLSEAADVKISVYNISGELVQSIENGANTPGIYESVINNKSLPSGVYLLNIRSSLFNETRSFVIIR